MQSESPPSRVRQRSLVATAAHVRYGRGMLFHRCRSIRVLATACALIGVAGAVASCAAASAAKSATPPSSSDRPLTTFPPTANPTPIREAPSIVPQPSLPQTPLVYAVDGTGSALITYTLPENPSSMQQLSSALPWESSDSNYANVNYSGISLSAQLQGAGSISCSITIEYPSGPRVIASARSAGQSVIALCVPS